MATGTLPVSPLTAAAATFHPSTPRKIAKDSKVLFMSDSSFSKTHGWMAGMGDRNGRWAAIIEKDGTVSYAENEASPKDVDVSLAFPSPLWRT